MKKRIDKKKKRPNNKKKKIVKNALASKPHMRKRIFITGSAMAACLILLIMRVAYLKSTYGATYEKTIANRMINGDQDIMPQRGSIVDRNYKTLATSVIAYNVILSPYDVLDISDMGKRAKVYETLAKNKKIGMTIAELKELVEANPTSKYKVLAKNLVEEEVEDLKGLGGVSLKETYTRKYPKGTLAAQVIGFYNKNGQGQYGIEQQYEGQLVGTAGRVFSQYQNSEVVTKQVKSAEPGATIKLTLDEIIQQYVETTMEKYIKEFNPLNATAIIMNPNTGEIYSMYSYPEFDPNNYNDLSVQLGEASWDSLSSQEQYEKLNEAWINRAIQYTYEPGSTFKPIFAAAALDEGLITGNETYNCTGSITIADTTIPCWKAGGHGVVTLKDVLAYSCNVGMIDISTKLTSDTILSYLNRYGFGQETGIGLPGENPGMLHKTLGPVEKATYSMGQGFTATPLQMINAFSAVINGGYLVEPYVVSEIVGNDKSIMYEHQKRILRQVISSETSKLVTNYMRKTVEDGTGTYATVNGYDIGGKTGTAQKIGRNEGEYVISFMGYAPISNPQVIGLIAFDEVPEDSKASTNAFREIMENVLPYLEIELNKNATADDKQTSEVPDLASLDLVTAITTLEQKGLDYEVIGNGSTIKNQYPKAGETVSRGSAVKLYMTTNQPDQITEVPNLVGTSVEEAAQLVKGQFTLKGATTGKITSQAPKAGTKVDKNTTLIVKTTE